MTEKYEDIINLPHHVSKTRPQMSIAGLETLLCFCIGR